MRIFNNSHEDQNGDIIRIIQQYNNIDRIMMLIMMAVVLWLGCGGQSKRMYAAIQTQQQLYFSYLPYVKSCDYNNITASPSDINVSTLNASVTIKLLDSRTFFNQIYFENIMTFWSPVRNGLNIMMVLPEHFSSDSGYIFDASKVNNFNRQLILYSINNSYNLSANSSFLTFYYTLNTISVSNMSLNVQVVNEQPISLTQQAIQLVQECPNNSAYSMSYIGNHTFMYVCGQSAAGFTFVPGQNQSSVTMLDFSVKIGYGSYELAINPLIINNPGFRDQFYWNCALYFANQTQTEIYFITYNFEYGNFSLLSFTSMEPQVNLLINRIWGLQVKKQISRWMDLFASFNISSTINFPGEIVSVFISTHENIFVESTDGSLNYLCIFDNSGALIENISYVGTIIYYGSKDVFIYNQPTDQLYQVIVDRPIFVMQFPDTSVPDTYSTVNISMQCEDSQQILNYQILWTSFNYPSALIVPIDQSPITTTNYIYGFQVTDRFLVIGPDFELVVNAQPTIQVIIIDSSTIIINKQAISIVNVEIYNGNFATIVFATSSGVYSINNRRQLQTLSSEPCGFDNIASVVKSGPDEYIVTNSASQQCSCSLDFTVCHIVSQNTAYWKLTSSTFMYENNSPFMNYINGMGNYVGGATQPSLVKKNIYTLIRDGYVVSILSNNTILLVNIRTKEIVDSAQMSNCQYNATNGGIYIRQFFDPFLILYCQQSTQLTQFIIRQGQIIYQRQIPLYRFSTRATDNAFFPGFTFVFISVDPTIQVYPLPENCCVLRLDPCQYTVSVIAEIINAQSIVMVTKYRNIDVALFKSTDVQDYQCIIKAYFPHIWVTLNQTNNSQVITQQPQKIQIIFESPRYNFAASFNLSIIFNLTGVNLTLNQSDVSRLAEFDLIQNITKHGNPQLTGANNYNFTQLMCGPIFQSFFYRQVQNMSNVEIIQNSVLTKTKILGNIGIQFIQIINPSKFSVSNLSLNYLILVVSVDKMFVYDKQLNGVEMAAIKNFTLPQRRCTYYLYQIINQTAATLTSNCEGINYNYRSPLLTINYEPVNGTFTSTYEWTVIPMALRQIYTIVRQNNQSTLVIGLLEGPMNAATGKLYICDGMICSPLYVSTRLVFLINYAAHVDVDDDVYVVMSIDCYTIQVYINPQVQPNGGIINSNYTFNYTQYVQQNYCSVIKVLNTTYTKAFCILSCSQYYYYIIMNYPTQQITILKRFVRYSQCDMEDVFRPYVVYASNSDVDVLLAPCRQNDYTFRLQAYETINSSTPIIFTGYLQIYTMEGPLGPTCLNDTLSPIKIISLSTSMNYPLFMTYSINGIQKFIYSQINGILIDNYVQSQLYLEVQYQPITIDFNYPKINLYIVNPFHRIVLNILTGPASSQTNVIRFVNCFVFAVFVAANIVTLTCLICYVSQNKQKSLLLQMQMRQSSGATSNPANQLEYQDPLKSINITLQKQRHRKTTLTKRNPNRPSQIQMYFVKRK